MQFMHSCLTRRRWPVVDHLAALLLRAERFLCNDTGIMHVAGAVGVPTVALFGPTDPALWKPPSDAVVAVTSPERSPHPAGDESIELLRALIRNACVNDGSPESGHESRSVGGGATRRGLHGESP